MRNDVAALALSLGTPLTLFILDELDKDRKFLTNSGVFSHQQIDAYIKLKMAEVEELNNRPHPIEFENYYSV